MKKALGIFLISLPFIALLIYCYLERGGIKGIGIFFLACGIVAVVFALVSAGTYLITGGK